MKRVHYDDLITEDNLYHLYQDKPFTGVGFDLWPNGTVREEQEFHEGWAAGFYRSYHENGRLRLSGEYVGSRACGLMREYDTDGKLTFEYFADHRKSFTHFQKRYNSAGEIIQIKLNGFVPGYNMAFSTEKIYFDNGLIKLETEFEVGYMVRQFEWDEYGNLIRQYFLVEGDKDYPDYQRKLDEYEEWKKKNMKP